MLASLLALKEKFSKHDLRSTKGRTERPLKENEAKLVTEKIKVFCPDNLVIPPAECPEALRHALHPQEYAIAKSNETSTMEYGFMATFRVATEGTRTLVVARALDVVQFLEKAGESAANIPPQRVYAFLKGGTSEQLAQFAAGAPAIPKLYYGTTGPNDLTYMPAGWAFAERAGKQKDIMGVRASVLLKSDRSRYDELAKWFQVCRKESANLSGCLDTLVLKG